jgi:hypothetical protein
MICLPTDSTFFTSSMLNMCIHKPCHCTVHVSVLIHFCDSVWSFWRIFICWSTVFWMLTCWVHMLVNSVLKVYLLSSQVGQ